MWGCNQIPNVFFYVCLIFCLFYAFRILILWQGHFTPQPMMNSLLTVTSVPETPLCPAQLLPIEDNEMVFPLPKNVPDPVGSDIKDIPQVAWRIS
jgi:hypothetical protein